MTTNTENIWIKQPLLAAEIYQVNFHPLQYNSPMDQEGNIIKMRFQQISLTEIKVELNQISANENSPVDQLPKGPNDIHPKFGPKPGPGKKHKILKRS